MKIQFREIKIHTREKQKKSGAFIEKLNNEIANYVSVHSTRHNDKWCSSTWISILHVLEDVSLLMGPDDPIPSLGWTEAQFTSNHCRVLMNERHCGRIKIARKAQKHTIVKENIDGHCSNAWLKGVRNFGVDHKNNALCISWDDKNKMKLGSPRYPLAMSPKSRPTFIPDGL